MLKERFISNALRNPYPQTLQEVASDIHESHRISDPYLYLVKNQLTTPDGLMINQQIERESYLGQIEYSAFNKVEQWAVANKSGIAVWFSPPFPSVYPVSKIIISELINKEDSKALFNRSVAFDVDGQTLVMIANQLVGDQGYFINTEELRLEPVFPDSQTFTQWFGLLVKYTNQINQIKNNTDIVVKNQTLRQLVELMIPIAGPNNLSSEHMYIALHDGAKEVGMIGQHPVSCPSKTKTTLFDLIFNNSLKLNNETYTVNCVCPHCQQMVTAIVSDGKITCPNCHESAPYKC